MSKLNANPLDWEARVQHLRQSWMERGHRRKASNILHLSLFVSSVEV